MNYQYDYKSIRPKLWEVIGKNGRALGRHIFSPTSKRVGWQASNGEFYEQAKQAAMALVKARKKKLALQYS